LHQSIGWKFSQWFGQWTDGLSLLSGLERRVGPRHVSWLMIPSKRRSGWDHLSCHPTCHVTNHGHT
jgi:hypothetical protein